MLLKRNLLETITIISCSGSLICIFLNYVTNISPLTGIWFICYILLLFITSVICSFKFMQWLLHLNKPIKYDIDSIVNKYPFLSDVLPKVNKKVEKVNKEYDTNELSVISTVLEKRLVSSWYVSYISEEIGFPFACKQMLDQMIAKAFQICDKIETKDVYVDFCTILISHLKEYKKALKRQESSPDNKVESLYKKIHPISDNNNKKHLSADHCINLLRIVLKELVPWELWDTPYSELLVRILAKKLDIFIDNTISNPIWLNDRLLTILNVEQVDLVDKPHPNQTKEASKPDYVDKKVDTIPESIHLKPNTVRKSPSGSPVRVVQKNVIPEEKEEIVGKDQNVEEAHVGSEPVEIKPVLRQRRGRQGRNEVKIYDRIIEGSVKTWDTDLDLQCISVGQDLLASLDEMTLSRLWGHEDPEHSPNLRGTSPQPLWFGEEDTIDLDNEPAKESKKEFSPKPADALLKDLQSTVHHAKAKIGDLQVPLNIDVTRSTSDEAAGMMEGLLDKGIAGLKKGLRFTGLSDDSQERGSEKLSPSELYRSKPKQEVDMDAKEAYISTNLQKDDTGNSVHTLVKQHRVTSQDSVMKPLVEWGPPVEALPESPEPQYEEAADLSASIAKLRSLLQHVERPRAEEVWWEGAEETRGRAQRRPSSKPVDTAALADEYDMSLERNASPGQTSNNMQRLDKLLQRTVTGVFNSIRTAVGAEGAGAEGGVEGAAGQVCDWTYVCTSPELSLGAGVGRLVGARRALWHVDAALDSLRHLPAPPPPSLQPLDLEEWCSGSGARWCGSCEVACAVGLAASHLAFRLATLLSADIAESLICSWLEELTTWLRKQLFVYFEQLSQPQVETDRKVREFNIDETQRVILEKMPETYLFSEQTLSEAVRLVTSSFSHQEVNKDVVFRALDIFVVHFKKSAGLRNPSFDNN